MNKIKAFIDGEGKAVIKCPECHEVRRVDVTGYAKLERFVRFNVKCPCSHTYKVVLERREYFRRQVQLTGMCLIQNGAQGVDVYIRDLSRKGLRIELMKDAEITLGEKVMVEFRLDDEKRTLIRKDAVVRSMRGFHIGLEFFSIDPHNVYDKALGFYLM
jgi:hypothetical protein